MSDQICPPLGAQDNASATPTLRRYSMDSPLQEDASIFVSEPLSVHHNRHSLSCPIPVESTERFMPSYELPPCMQLENDPMPPDFGSELDESMMSMPVGDIDCVSAEFTMRADNSQLAAMNAMTHTPFASLLDTGAASAREPPHSTHMNEAPIAYAGATLWSSNARSCVPSTPGFAQQQAPRDNAAFLRLLGGVPPWRAGFRNEEAQIAPADTAPPGAWGAAVGMHGWRTAPCTPARPVRPPPFVEMASRQQHERRSPQRAQQRRHGNADIITFSPVSPLMPDELRDMIDGLSIDEVNARINHAVENMAKTLKVKLRSTLKDQNMSDNAREARVSRYRKECEHRGYKMIVRMLLNDVYARKRRWDA